MSQEAIDEIVNGLQTVKARIFNVALGGVIGGVIILVSFYFTATAQLQKHDEEIKTLKQQMESKPDMRDIQNLQKSLDEVKATNTQILNILIQRDGSK